MTPHRLPALLATIAALAVMAMAPANAKFTAFPAKPAFGKRVMPTFKGSNHKYSEFRTALTEGFRNGPHFAGHYVLIGIGCGAGCRTFYLGDLNTGLITDFPRGGEDNMYLELTFKPNSRLVRATWAQFSKNGDDLKTCTHEDFVLNGAKFDLIGRSDVKGACPV
jgi:hypothetical protein